MTFVVTENCINCKHTTCIEVCPTDAFREGRNMLVIEPEACIDCNLCPAECPVDAIYADYEVPEEQKHFVELNVELASRWPEITEVKLPLKDHDHWDGIPDKLPLLELE